MAEGAPQRCGAPRRRARPAALQGQGRAGSSRTSRSSTWRRSSPPRPARVMRALSTASRRCSRRPRARTISGRSTAAWSTAAATLDDGVIVLPLTLACEHHADLVQRALRHDRGRRTRTSSPRSTTPAGPAARSSTSRAACKVESPIVLTAISDADQHRAAPARADRARGGRRGRGLGAAPLRLDRRRDDAQLRRRAARRPERPAALRRRPGHEREVVGLRLPARRGRPRRAPGLGHGRLRLGQRQGVHGDAAGGRGLARQGHRRLRPARAPARGLPHAAGARRGEHDVRPRLPRHPRRPLVASSGAG